MTNNKAEISQHTESKCMPRDMCLLACEGCGFSSDISFLSYKGAEQSRTNLRRSFIVDRINFWSKFFWKEQLQYPKSKKRHHLSRSQEVPHGYRVYCLRENFRSTLRRIPCITKIQRITSLRSQTSKSSLDNCKLRAWTIGKSGMNCFGTRRVYSSKRCLAAQNS